MAEKLTIEFPSQGWSQFLTARKEMLDAFDRAREKARSHEVESFHGRVAESEFRKWLSAFLPKRYGVTSGYIVSSGLKSTNKTPHYDVIVYDQIESPVLWVEGYSDVSPQGRSLAIPVEYVRAVLEVKSSFSPTTVGQALEHLRDLLPLMGGIDEPNERYKLHLPFTFCCGLVFFELKKDYEYSEAAMSKIIAGVELRGFFGGIILRGEGHNKPVTGKLRLARSETPREGTIGKNKASLLKGGLGPSIQLAENLHYCSFLMWLELNFSQFGFELIDMMQGKYDGGVSSFYGMGETGWE